MDEEVQLFILKFSLTASVSFTCSCIDFSIADTYCLFILNTSQSNFFIFKILTICGVSILERFDSYYSDVYNRCRLKLHNKHRQNTKVFNNFHYVYVPYYKLWGLF